MLQWIKWNTARPEKSAAQLRAALPEAVLTQLRLALDDPAAGPQLRAILRAHPEWLPLETWMRPDYYFKVGAKVKGNVPIDVFASRMDSTGARAFLYYFGPHAVIPFSSDGNPNVDVAEMMEIIKWHAGHLFSRMPKRHGLSPSNMFAAEASHWKKLPDHYSSLSIYFFFGRRKDFVGKNRELRAELVAQTKERWRERVLRLGFNLELLSYDRLLSSVSGERVLPPPTLL